MRRRALLLDAGLPSAQFLGRLPLVAAQFGDQRDHAGVDAGPAGRLPCLPNAAFNTTHALSGAIGQLLRWRGRASPPAAP